MEENKYKVLKQRGPYQLRPGRCNTCRHWHIPDHDHKDRNGDLARLPLPRAYFADGRCRRFPLSREKPESGMQADAWPATMMHDWCGEYAEGHNPAEIEMELDSDV